MQFAVINNKRVAYKQNIGKGPTLLFLHGYLESMNVFGDFATKYLSNHNYLLVDVPGHGNSEMISPQQTMHNIALQIFDLLDYLKIEKVMVYGHSMGGYVALAMANADKNRLSLLGLLHSNVFADSEEKKANRLREVELIKLGKLSTIATSFMPNIVSEKHYPALKHSIDSWIRDAEAMTPEGIIACLHAMMNRPDNQQILNGETPIHLIASDSDKFLPLTAIETMKQGTAVKYFTMIPDCGHASFVEKPEILYKELKRVLTTL